MRHNILWGGKRTYREKKNDNGSKVLCDRRQVKDQVMLSRNVINEKVYI